LDGDNVTAGAVVTTEGLLPPHAAIARISNNPAANGKKTVRQRLGPKRRQAQAIHAKPVNKTQSVNKGRRVGSRGGVGRTNRGGAGGAMRGPIIAELVVVTLSVTVCAELVGVIEAGVNVQATPGGSVPVQAKVMV
jgi:hypothetical protein